MITCTTYPTLRISDHPTLINDNSLRCTKCDKQFKLKKCFNNHISKCGQQFKCGECGRVFRQERYFKEHLNQKHTNTWIRCGQCGKAFTSVRYLKRHERRLHRTDHVVYSCNQCNSTYPCKEYLSRHIKSSHSPNKIHCTICGINFANSYNLKRHQIMQHVKKTLKCIDCDLYLDSLHEWINHCNTHKKKPYACRECPKSFNRYTNLYRHSSVHCTQKSFHCNLCDKSFKLKQSLVRHQTHQHYKQRNFVCSTCGKRFSRKCVLTVHSKTHSPQTFHCKIDNCSSSFRTNVMLGIHVANSHYTYFLHNKRLRAAQRREAYRQLNSNMYDSCAYYYSY